MKLNKCDLLKIYFALAIVVLWATPSFALNHNIYENNTVKVLKTYERSGQLFDHLMKKLEHKGSDDDMIIYASWLDKRVSANPSTFRYPMMASLYQHKLGNEKKSSELMLYAIVMQFVDVHRCKDQQSVHSRYKELASYMVQSGALDYFKSLSIDDRKQMIDKAIGMEIENNNRKGDEWLCYSFNYHDKSYYIDKISAIGSKNMSRDELKEYMQTIRNEMNNEVKINSFISDDKWHEKHPKVIKEVKKVLTMLPMN